jgi:DNA-directed RNA polymerase specialized sigma24 family protein
MASRIEPPARSTVVTPSLPPFQTLLEKHSEDVRRAARQRAPAAEPAAEDPPAPDETIWSAVAALAPRQRAAVVLRYIGDLSHREIAAAIGCSEEASRRSLHDGLETLRRQL